MIDLLLKIGIHVLCSTDQAFSDLWMCWQKKDVVANRLDYQLTDLIDIHQTKLRSRATDLNAFREDPGRTPPVEPGAHQSGGH